MGPSKAPAESRLVPSRSQESELGALKRLRIAYIESRIALLDACDAAFVLPNFDSVVLADRPRLFEGGEIVRVHMIHVADDVILGVYVI
jgi:hypothetical protein